MAELQQLKTAISISSGTSSPKPIVQRRAASPPRPQGNGLLSSASFGIQGGIANPSFEIPTIVLDIPLNLTGSNTFNIQRMAEEKYGWAALNPKVAYRQVQEKLAAAAGKSAKRNSGDDMDLDDSDGDEDNDPSTDDATSSLVDKPKRRRAIEEYDMRDPFIDDEEQIWEEQQKATKEGFFVFSGPLLADDGPKENEKYSHLPLSCDTIPPADSRSRADGAQPKRRAPAKSGTRARTSGAMAGKATRPRMSDADTGTDQKPGKRKRRTRAEMEAARAAGKVGPVKRVNKPLPTLAARPESTIVNSDY